MPPMTLKQKAEDDRRLKQHSGKSDQKQSVVLLPCRRLPKADLTACGQCGFADLPALELPPVENRFGEFSNRNRDCCDARAFENAQCKPSDRVAVGYVIED